MPSSQHALTLLLFRDESIAWARRLPETLDPAGASEGETRKEALARFEELIGEGRRWARHVYLWCLHGRHKLEQSVVLSEFAGESYTYSARALVIQKLARTYSWCLIPWGGDFTSQMLAFVSTDETATNLAIESLRESGCSDLIVSRYTREDLEHNRFKGAIFSRKPASRAQGLWNHGIGSAGSVLILRSDADVTSFATHGTARPVLETRATVFGAPILRTWMRIEDEVGFLRYALDPFTAIITAPDLDESHMRHALESFEGVSRDALHFGIKALGSASWIYIPGTEREKLEVYVNKDPDVTTSLLQNKPLTSSSFFAHRFFF
jgi:hypothetical protein